MLHHRRQETNDEESPYTRPRSVPSKWDMEKTIVAFEPRGFGSKSLRFSGDDNEIPGPGYYYEDASPVIDSPSISTKGYSNAFASKTKKLSKSNDVHLLTPGPGKYELPGAMEDALKRSANRRGGTVSFLPSPSERVPYPHPLARGYIPGPLDYHVNYNFESPRFQRKQMNASFRSRSPKTSVFDQPLSDAPGPAKYRIDDKLYTPSNSVVWSRTTDDRFRDADNGVPPPTTYFPTRPVSRASRPQTATSSDLNALTAEASVYSLASLQTSRSMRSAGGYRGPYVGKQHEHIPCIDRTFGTSKSKQSSFLGNLEEKSHLPGPGSYSLREETPSVIRSRLKEEELRKERLQYLRTRRKSPVKSSPMFRSKSPNHMSLEKPRSQYAPGPCHYNPRLKPRKPTLLNLDGKWIC